MVVQKETALQNRIRLELSEKVPSLTHFRNHTGCLPDGKGGMVRFGLGAGSPDLVGYKEVLIDSSMVGQTMAVFVGLEIKLPGEKPRADQRHWLELLAEAGGIAAVVTSPEDAIDAVS